MTLDRRKLRWNGWGWAHATFELGAREPTVWAYIAEALGRDKLARSPAVPLPDIHMAGSRLDDETLANLQAITGIEHVKTDRYERAFHARGKSYLDLLRLRAGCRRSSDQRGGQTGPFRDKTQRNHVRDQATIRMNVP